MLGVDKKMNWKTEVIKKKNLVYVMGILIMVSIILIRNITSKASTDNFDVAESNHDIQLETTLDLSDITSDKPKLASLEIQLNDLYIKIANELNCDLTYVNLIHQLAGGRALYININPNIYSETTLESVQKPASINLGEQIEIVEAPFIITDETNKSIRKSEYYLPDALYSICKRLIEMEQERKDCDRKQYAKYFDSLDDEAKHQLLFIETVLLYTGEAQEIVDNVYPAYQKILELELQDKSAIKEILQQVGIIDETRLEYVCLILNSNECQYKNKVLPYEINYMTKENMFITAASLVGKVRYVWGGGHSGTSYIKGINPAWEEYNRLYLLDEYGYNKSIKSTESWCPMHGNTESGFHGETINTVDEYINLRKDYYTDMDEEVYSQYLSQIDNVYLVDGTWKDKKIDIHSIDGLDCSGYIAWIFTQMMPDSMAALSASDFVKLNGFYEIPLGERMLPGDLFAWTEHIVLIVGETHENSKVYITLEATLNMIKFGVLHYEGAKENDILEAMSIAEEANKIAGNINNELDPLHVYCIDKVKYYTTEESLETDTEVDTSAEENQEGDLIELSEDIIDEEGTPEEETPEEDISEDISKEENNTEEKELVTKEFAVIGRYLNGFVDNDESNFSNSYAVEIIQHTFDKLPITYLLGYNEYEGDFFNKNSMGLSIGIEKIDVE